MGAFHGATSFAEYAIFSVVVMLSVRSLIPGAGAISSSPCVSTAKLVSFITLHLSD
jgi:hypothetical protein